MRDHRTKEQLIEALATATEELAKVRSTLASRSDDLERIRGYWDRDSKKLKELLEEKSDWYGRDTRYLIGQQGIVERLRGGLIAVVGKAKTDEIEGFVSAPAGQI